VFRWDEARTFLVPPRPTIEPSPRPSLRRLREDEQQPPRPGLAKGEAAPGL